MAFVNGVEAVLSALDPWLDHGSGALAPLAAETLPGCQWLLFAGGRWSFQSAVVDRGFSLVLGQLLLKALCGLLEAGIAINFFGAVQKNESNPQKQNETCDPRHRPKLSADVSADVGRRGPRNTSPPVITPVDAEEVPVHWGCTATPSLEKLGMVSSVLVA